MRTSFKKNQTGFTIIEVLVACFIMTLITLTLMSAAAKGIELSNQSLRQAQAGLLLEEGAEAVKSIRDTSWPAISGLSLETNYYLYFDSGTNTWSLSTTPLALLDGVFSRSVVISSVYRDSNDEISLSGTLDTGTKKVNVIVTWPNHQNVSSKNLTFYLADIFN